MSSWEVFFHRLAGREYLKAMEKYRGISDRVFLRFLQAVDDAIEKVADDPNQWPKYRHGHRWVRLRKFPYILFFRVKDPDRVEIMAFAHNSRRPGYWLRRERNP